MKRRFNAERKYFFRKAENIFFGGAAFQDLLKPCAVEQDV
jgi:hypothetical protein